MRVGRGGLGARASLEVSRRFRNRGNGQTGTVWQLSGRPTDSESDNPAADIELRSVSALRYRLPYLPVCDRQGEEGDRARCGWVHREEGPGGDPGSRKERLAFPPLTLILLTYPRERQAREGPQPSPRSRRAPDSTAPAGRPTGAGAGRAASSSFTTWPGLLHRPCLGQIQGFLLIPHPHPVNFPGLGAHPLLSWGRAQGRTAPPLPALPEPRRLKRRPRTPLDHVAGCVELGAG